MEIQLHNITVDVMKREDMQWVVEVACIRMLIEEVNQPKLANKESIYKLAEAVFNMETAFVCKVDGVPVGVIGGVVVPHVFNEDITTLSELIWYVLPEYRSGRAGALLLKAFTEKGEEVADETTFSLLSTSPVKISTLEKRGFYLREFAFRKENK